MNHRAVTLTSAPYDTVTLALTPYNVEGKVLPMDDATTRFVSLDTTTMKVSASGLVTMVRASGQAWIRGSITRGGVTLTDSALVSRPDVDPVVTGISAAPVAPDSAKNAAYEFATPIYSYLSGSNLTGVAVSYEIGDTTVATLSESFFPAFSMMSFYGNVADPTGAASAYIAGFRAGKIWVRVSTYTRGVTWTDSVQYTIGYPLSTFVSVDHRVRNDGSKVFELSKPDTVRLGVGSVVSWSAPGDASTPAGIVFEDSSKARPGSGFGASAKSGNIDPWTLNLQDFSTWSRSRQFVRPDTIRWRSPEVNVSGTLIIVDERACLPSCPPFP